MRTNRLLTLLLVFKRRIIACAQLIERQELGPWPGINGDDLLGGFELIRGAAESAGNLFLDPHDEDSSRAEPQPATDTTSDGKTSQDVQVVAPASPPSSDTVYKIKISNDPPSSPLPDLEPNRPALLPLVNEECDITDADCGKTTDQLIFTSSCASMSLDQVVSDEVKTQNRAIQEALDRMNDDNILAGKGGRGLRISRIDNICDVYFFAVPLTPSQLREIENMPGVRVVTPNQALYTRDVKITPPTEGREPAKMPVQNVPGSRLKRRDRLVEDLRAGKDLRFISTPKDLKLSGSYSYYEEAGEDVTIIAVAHGVNALHDEFVTATGESSILEDPIMGMDASGQPDPVSTCHASKMVGRTYGVARRAKVKVVNVADEPGSFLDGLSQVTRYLTRKHLRRERYRGYHVMSIMHQWDYVGALLTFEFEGLIVNLINMLQLVIVVQAGQDQSNQNSDINTWPGTAAGRHEIIVVGAVDVETGRSFDFSRGGPFLTVNAPGEVRCADQPGTYFGTDVASAEATALIAYFLSLRDIGPTLRGEYNNIPSKVKKFIQEVSYTRTNGDFPAVWNRLPEPGITMGTEPDIFGVQARDRISKLRC